MTKVEGVLVIAVMTIIVYDALYKTLPLLPESSRLFIATAALSSLMESANQIKRRAGII